MVIDFGNPRGARIRVRLLHMRVLAMLLSLCAVGTACSADREMDPVQLDPVQLAYELDAHGERALSVAAADGSARHRLTSGLPEVSHPAWSPDGGHLAFSAGGVITTGDVYTVRLDGSPPSRITTHAGFDGQPAWKPGA
jgi:hypothetical protein